MHVLLTGASGFLGAFLVQQLFAQLSSTAVVHCHLRADNVEAGTLRLVRSLKAHGVWTDDMEDRLTVHVGDLAAPRLGLAKREFDELASTIDIIFHNGAYVHWILPYEALKATNVDSTKEVLHLSLAGARETLLVFVSTNGVFDNYQRTTHGETISSDDSLSRPLGLRGGYSQSKFVADRMLLRAAKRGARIAVFRPAYILGDSVTGVWNVDDFLARILKGCLQLGAYPTFAEGEDPPIEGAPVDAVAHLIVHRALALYGDDDERSLVVVSVQGKRPVNNEVSHCVHWCTLNGGIFTLGKRRIGTELQTTLEDSRKKVIDVPDAGD
jgi:thioester reductase-like protein